MNPPSARPKRMPRGAIQNMVRLCQDAHHVFRCGISENTNNFAVFKGSRALIKRGHHVTDPKRLNTTTSYDRPGNKTLVHDPQRHLPRPCFEPAAAYRVHTGDGYF